MPLTAGRSGVRRRTLLAAGLASAVFGASGCRGGSEVDTAPAVTVDARALSRQNPFFIGARGSSRDWPELTAYGFEQAAAIPEIKAMEVWVCRTSDGVLVCSADATTARLTGQNLTILDETWATLSSLRVTSSQTTDRSQPSQPFARLEDVLDRFIDRFVFFVEPRVPEAITNLTAHLLALGRPERIVWKQPINSTRFDAAKQHGFSTWGYVLDEPAHTGRNLSRLASSDVIDMLGVAVGRPTKLISSVVDAARQNQKPVITWNVDSQPNLDRALKLGCAGIASRAVREIVTASR